jgi:hypothetical protein
MESGRGRVCLRRVPIEESFKLKRKLTFLLLAVVPVALAPLTASSQVNTEAAPATQQTPTYKYEVYAGLAYTRIRQVPVSYSGLVGGKVSLTRDFGKYFLLMASADDYKLGTGHAGLPNPGHPTVDTFMLGPGIHANLYEKLSAELFAEVGGEHTGGESMTPTISFAGGFGGGLIYDLSGRLALQLTGDRVGASFSLPNNTSQAGYSTHRTWNARGTFGVVYRF